MANAFNEFFSSIGTDISNSIPTTNTDPLSYMENDENVTLLDLGTTSQIHICDVIKSMLSKNRLDEPYQKHCYRDKRAPCPYI